MNTRRPPLTRATDPGVFNEYYWLKRELTDFCKSEGLPRGGSKDELTARIHAYLMTGKLDVAEHKKKRQSNRARGNSSTAAITLYDPIPPEYRSDQRHRAFFQSAIGPHFKFNVPFMNWMRANAGKTYADAINAWNSLVAERKKPGKKTAISPQFQYNQYTRDFFAANPDATRVDAIKCWTYKKARPGHNRYEKADLEALVEAPQE